MLWNNFQQLSQLKLWTGIIFSYKWDQHVFSFKFQLVGWPFSESSLFSSDTNKTKKKKEWQQGRQKPCYQRFQWQTKTASKHVSRMLNVRVEQARTLIAVIICQYDCWLLCVAISCISEASHNISKCCDLMCQQSPLAYFCPRRTNKVAWLHRSPPQNRL